MRDFVTHCIIKLKTHKRLVIIIGSLLLLLLLLIFVFTARRENDQPEPGSSPSPTITPITVQQTPFPTRIITEENIHFSENELKEHLGIRSDLIKKDGLPDGTIRYYFDSSRIGRLNMVVTKGEEILLQREVLLPDMPTSLSDISTAYGEPNRILKGSHYYGADIQTHVYAESGMAFVVNPQTNLVLEKHLFYPTTTDDYIKRFGEDSIEK